jgi:hypothetical protein
MDWSTGLLALYLLWRHQLAAGGVVMLVPPAVVSWLVIRYANLERTTARIAIRRLRRSVHVPYHGSGAVGQLRRDGD